MIEQELVTVPTNSASFAHETTLLTVRMDLSQLLDEVAEERAKELRTAENCAPTRSDLRKLACWMYDARRTRDRMLSHHLLGEPAWDMLLTLYSSSARGEVIGVTALSYAAGIPLTTGHRWQAVLTDQGMIERGPPALDLRRQNVRLTMQGKTLIEAYLTRLFLCSRYLPPWNESVGG